MLLPIFAIVFMNLISSQINEDNLIQTDFSYEAAADMMHLCQHSYFDSVNFFTLFFFVFFPNRVWAKKKQDSKCESCYLSQRRQKKIL